MCVMYAWLWTYDMHDVHKHTYQDVVYALLGNPYPSYAVLNVFGE